MLENTKIIVGVDGQFQDCQITSHNIVVGPTGDVYACLGRHSIGNILTDDFTTIVANPRYQEFLTNQVAGTVDPWCAICDRNG